MGQIYLIYGNDEQAVKKKAAAIAGKFTADNENICDTETIAGDAGKSALYDTAKRLLQPFLCFATAVFIFLNVYFILQSIQEYIRQ